MTAANPAAKPKPTLTLEGLVKGIKAGAQSTTLEISQEGLQYPVLISFFQEAQDGIKVKVGQRARVTYILSERVTAAGNPYKNGVGAVPLGETAPPPEEEELFPPGSPGYTPPMPRTASGSPLAASPAAGVSPDTPRPQNGGWREAYSQGREAHEATRLSIEAQVCLQQAWETVRDLMRTDKVQHDDPVAIHRLLADYAMMGMAVLRETKAAITQEEG